MGILSMAYNIRPALPVPLSLGSRSKTTSYTHANGWYPMRETPAFFKEQGIKKGNSGSGCHYCLNSSPIITPAGMITDCPFM